MGFSIFDSILFLLKFTFLFNKSMDYLNLRKHQQKPVYQLKNVNLWRMLTLLQMNSMIIYTYQITKWVSNGKWTLTQTQTNKSNKFFLVEKLRRLFILHFVLIAVLSWKPISKTPWQISWRLINIWRIFESNYYQARQSCRNVAKIPKNVATYKAFVRSHLDYDNWIYDETYNETFHQ